MGPIYPIFQVKDVLHIHRNKCPNFNKTVHVSVDGVSECRSNINSMDVYSTRFFNCRTVYPILIARPIRKYRIDSQKYLDYFLSDVCSNGCKIDAFVADSQKRSNAKVCKGHGSYFPCEYCESKGQLLNSADLSFQEKKIELLRQKDIIHHQLRIAEESHNEEQIEILRTVQKTVNESIKNLKKTHNNIVWPASTMNGPKRTTEKVLSIVNRLENNEILSAEECKGVMGRSLFLEIPYFNFVLDMPAEYLHGVCLGVVKRMIILTFNVGENRKRNTNRKLSSTDTYNKLMASVKSPRESSRRSRCLDLSVMKGQEFRNCLILFFPIIITCIEPEAEERRLWLLLTYMIRACILPNNEFDTIDDNVVTYCGQEFYELYEKLFHARNCSYYTHVISCHMLEIRRNGPLTMTSAFAFESFYGELRNSFQPGTVSPLKQILSQVMLKRSISSHCCESSIFYSPKDTPLESNSLIYTFNENQYEFYKIKSIQDNSMDCYKVGKSQTSFPETPTLNWSNIGVFKAEGIFEEIVEISKQDICGKVIKVQDLYVTCPINVLLEK